MRTRFAYKPAKVNVITLGCSKNQVDSEELLTQLRANAIEAEHEGLRDDAGVIVINTCGFIEEARQESIDTILRYVEAKREGLVEKVYVTGCLSARYGPELEAEIPDVDAYFGTRDLPRLLKTLKADYRKELVGERLLTTPSHYAYLKIAEGCDRPCSFCAIPIMRGGHTSETVEHLVARAGQLAAQGTKELILIAQDLTYYGLDIYRRRALAELIDRLADVEGISWIRLQYAYPAGFPMEVLEVMARRPNVCKYLDMPLQHGADNVLKLMRRGITRARTEALLSDIRNRLPEISIRTTLISGHPGETEDDHEEMLEFVARSRFDRLGVFTYSHEEGTHAHSMVDSVPEEVKQQRREDIMTLQQDISLELNQARIGRTMTVLVDRREGGRWVGRTEHDSPEVDNEVILTAVRGLTLAPGMMIPALITQASEYDLTARPLTADQLMAAVVSQPSAQQALPTLLPL